MQTSSATYGADKWAKAKAEKMLRRPAGEVIADIAQPSNSRDLEEQVPHEKSSKGQAEEVNADIAQPSTSRDLEEQVSHEKSSRGQAEEVIADIARPSTSRGLEEVQTEIAPRAQDVEIAQASTSTGPDKQVSSVIMKTVGIQAMQHFWL